MTTIAVRYLSPKEVVDLIQPCDLEPFLSVSQLIAYTDYALNSSTHEWVFRNKEGVVIWMAGHEDEFRRRLVQKLLPVDNMSPLLVSAQMIFKEKANTIRSSIVEWSWMIDEFFAKLGFQKIKYIEHDIVRN